MKKEKWFIARKITTKDFSAVIVVVANDSHGIDERWTIVGKGSYDFQYFILKLKHQDISVTD